MKEAEILKKNIKICKFNFLIILIQFDLFFPLNYLILFSFSYEYFSYLRKEGSQYNMIITIPKLFTIRKIIKGFHITKILQKR